MNRLNEWLKSNYIILLIIVLAAILRFYHIDFQSVWLDEICSINEANPNLYWKDLEATILVSDPHPPLYFALLKTLFQLFGYTTLVARNFSAVVGVLGVFSFYLLGKELVNKKVGLIAAFLLAINYFHIYYSQEVRMYALLFLFTVLSYYRLAVFLKSNTYKNAIWFGVFTGLMLLTQFFGIFVLASQLFILLIIFIKTEKNNKLQFLYKSLISGLISSILFIPAINIFIETTKKKYASIQPTTIDTILQIFKDFAENSNYLLITSIGLILAYFFFSIKEKQFKKREESLILLVVLSWIGITLLLPIIRSYLVAPMIISRYFITILPPIILLIAMGIKKINSKIIYISCIVLFMLVSFYELIFINDYYNKIAKTQFRETTEFIKSNNENNDEVVSGINWYLIYFFKDKNESKITEGFLESHIKDMSSGKKMKESFWYFGAFGDYFKLSETSNKFINDNFILEKSVQNFDSWAKHFVLKNSESLKIQNLPTFSVTLSDTTDENWYGGVGITYNMLLVENSVENEAKIKSALALKLKNNKTLKIIGYEKAGNYLHLQLQENASKYKEIISYPNIIEIIKNEQSVR